MIWQKSAQTINATKPMKTIRYTLCLTALLLAGCAYVEELKLPVVTPEGESLDTRTADTRTGLQPRYYPEDMKVGKPLNIEVVRVGNAIRLVNYTVREYHDVELWLNEQYGGDIEHIKIGHNGLINLSSFINRYGEPYPVARFLAPDADTALVLGDLVVGDTLHKLTVRLGNDWRSP